MKRFGIRCFALVALVASLARPVNAQFIISPTGGVINSGGPGFGTLTETWDQSGLLTGFTNGVTSFDSYIAGNPLHTSNFEGFEWFSNSGSTSASVTYDMGAIGSFDRLALWNEETSGIGRLNLSYSTDNVNFFSLASNLTPTDNPLVGIYTPYGADIFSFGPTSFQWVRFDMDLCPQQNPGNFPGCAIGEVAFRTSGEEVVPEPATMSLLATGLAGMAAARRRRKKA